MRANAKGVLACAVIGLIGVSAWWVWRELRPYVPKNDSSPVGGRKMVLGSDLGVMGYLEAQSLAGGIQVPGNPFMSSDQPWQWTLPIDRKITVEVDIQKPPQIVSRPPVERPVRVVKQPPRVPPKEEPLVPVVTPPVVKPPPPVKPVFLTYRGVFERPDGTALALIQDSETSKSAFYGSGDELYGVKLVDIAKTNATVETLDGVGIAISLSTPTKFVDGRHVD